MFEYLDEVNDKYGRNEKFLTWDQERDLVKRAQAGDREAMAELVRRFRPMLAKAVLNQPKVVKDRRAFTEDAFSYVVEQFIKAVHRFDPEMNNRLSTFVHRSVILVLRRYTAKYETSTCGFNGSYVSKCYFEFCRRDFEVTAQEVAEVVGCDLEHAEYAKSMFYGDSELDAPLRSDGATTHGETLQDGEPSPESEAHRKSVKRLALKLMDAMTDRQRWVVEQRMADRTLKEIGDELDLTRERVRQIEESGYRNMRKKAEREKLDMSNFILDPST